MSDKSGSSEPVRLPDLETIRRFSIAVRSEHADVDDVIDALRQDLQKLLEQTGRLRSKSQDDDSKSSRSGGAAKRSSSKTSSSKAKTRKR